MWIMPYTMTGVRCKTSRCVNIVDVAASSKIIGGWGGGIRFPNMKSGEADIVVKEKKLSL